MGVEWMVPRPAGPSLGAVYSLAKQTPFNIDEGKHVEMIMSALM